MARPKKLARGQKSQAIRNYLKSHRGAGPSAVVAALAQEGIAVSSQMVSNIKTRMVRRRRTARVSASGNGSGPSLDSLLAAKRLAKRVGGIDQARAAVNALAKLA
jgi:hypothetical protein